MTLLCTDRSRASVRIGQEQAEPLRQVRHVDAVPFPRLVSAVVFDLQLRGEAGDDMVENSALPESRGWVRAVGPIRRRTALPGRTFGVERDKVKINLPAVGRLQDDPRGRMVLGHAVAERPQGVEHIADGVPLDDNIGVVMHPGLSTEQRIDPPAAIEPCSKSSRFEELQDPEDLESLHRLFLSQLTSIRRTRISRTLVP